MSNDKVTVFCFNKLIYNGNVTFDFLKFCLKKCKFRLFSMPYVVYFFINYKKDILNREMYVNRLLKCFFNELDITSIVTFFWKKYKKRLNSDILIKVKESNGIIITSSFDFIVAPLFEDSNVKIIGTKYNKDTNQLDGEICAGTEKIIRLNSIGIKRIDELYICSLQDDYALTRISNTVFLFADNQFVKQPEREKSYLRR